MLITSDQSNQLPCTVAPLLSWFSCRLWLSRNTPLSLWSFSPSGAAPSSAARALDRALFCLHDLQLTGKRRSSTSRCTNGQQRYETAKCKDCVTAVETQNYAVMLLTANLDLSIHTSASTLNVNTSASYHSQQHLMKEFSSIYGENSPLIGHVEQQTQHHGGQN